MTCGFAAVVFPDLINKHILANDLKIGRKQTPALILKQAKGNAGVSGK